MGSFSAHPALYLSGIHVHRKAIVTTHSPNTPEPQTTPLAARIRLAHAYFQRIADMHSIDILHVKGYAFSQEIYRKGRYSSDADLLVPPLSRGPLCRDPSGRWMAYSSALRNRLRVRARNDALPRFMGPN